MLRSTVAASPLLGAVYLMLYTGHIETHHLTLAEQRAWPEVIPHPWMCFQPDSASSSAGDQQHMHQWTSIKV